MPSGIDNIYRDIDKLRREMARQRPQIVGDLPLVDVSAFASVAAAVTAAPSGNTLYFRPGTYPLTTTLTVDKPLTLHFAPGAVISVQTALGAAEKLISVVSDDVHFVNPVFDGSSAPAGTLTGTRKVCIYVGDGTTLYENVTITDPVFRNLTRRGTLDAGGTASTLSDYGILINKARNVHVVRPVADQLSGCAAYVITSNDVHITDGNIAMDTSAQCLYPLHVSGACDRVWIEGNTIRGGDRRSGGAIDVMSISNVNKRIYIHNNIIDACNGDASGTAVIRMLSTEDGEIVGNIVRGITSDEAVYINVNYRDLPTAQTGPVHNLVADNLLVCGGTDQRAIDARNDHASGTGGDDVVIARNQCVSDGTNYFAGGIRGRDIDRLRILDNTVLYSYSATLTASWGIDISGSLTTLTRPLVRGNEIDCRSVASSRAIEVQGTVSKPYILHNTLKDWGAFGLRIETTVADPLYGGNIFDGTASTAVSDLSSGASIRRGNFKGGINDEGVNVRDFGATGDGTTDDTAAIQAAINAAEVVGGVVMVPPGTYRLNTGLTWLHATSADRGNIMIIGSGYDTVFQAGADGLTLLTVDQSNSNYQGMLIEGIRFEMGNYSGRALHVRRGGSIGKLHRLWARGGANITGGLIELGVEASTEVSDFTIEDVYCYANVFTTDRPAFGIRAGSINTMHINHYSSVGPAIGFGNQVSPVPTQTDIRLSQCRFENGVYGVKYQDAGLLGYTIRDSRFEDLSAAGISIEGYDASNPATSGVIEGNYFTSLSDTGEVGVFDGRRQGIALEKIAGLQISGNYFNSASAGTGNAIYFVIPVNITRLVLMANYTNPVFTVRTAIPNYSTTLEINDYRAMQASKDTEYAAGGGYRQVIDGWYYDNAAASLSAAAMTRLGGTAEDSYVCMRAGSITGVSVRTSSPRTAGTLTATVYRDGAAIGLTAVLDGTNTIFKATTQGMDVNTFAAGGRLDVRLTTSADWAPTTADIRAAIEVEM